MPKPILTNVLNNPVFEYWDYTSSLSLSSIGNGYSATRWKTILTGSPLGTITKATSSSSLLKWIRSRSCMSVAITDLAGGNVTVRQYLENGQAYSRCTAALTVVAAGPAGATFRVAVGGEQATITTRGAATPVTVVSTFMVPDLTTEYLTVDIFTSPAAAGTFTIHAASLALGDPNVGDIGIFLPDKAVDRQACDRYCQPLGPGLVGTAASASSLPTPVRFLTTMRVNPSLVATASSLTALTLSDGSTVSNAAPVLSLGGLSTKASRMASTGWTGLTTGASYMISTPTIGVLHADY